MKFNPKESIMQMNTKFTLLIPLVLILLTAKLDARPTDPSAEPADSNKVGVLTVSSAPQDADVFIDGKMMGRTPVQLPGIPAGNRIMRIAKTGFCDITDTVRITPGLTVDRTVQLDSSCGLVVNSVPDSAAVYVEDVLVGRSPLRFSSAVGGWKSVKVMKLNKATWEDHVFLVPGTTVTVNANLKTKFGVLSVDVYSDDIDVVVDGKTAGKGSLIDFMIPGGMHDIGARNPDGSASAMETIYVHAGERVHLQARFGDRSMKAFLCSLVVPGLGQALTGSLGEGLIFMGGFAAAGVFTAVMNNRYQGEVNQYNDALERYRAASTEDAAKVAGNSLASQYQRLSSPYKLRTAGFALAGAVYIFSLVEAFLNHTTVNTLSLTAVRVDERMGPDVAVSPSGGRITFRVLF